MDQAILQRVLPYPGRSTRAIVDLDAIATNVATIKATVGPLVSVMAVVKANAYGHGSIAVAQAALAAGADHLGVATVDEGVHLRRAGIQAPVLVLGPIDSSEIDLALGRGLELAVGDLAFAQELAAASEREDLPARVHVHLKVDTGMHRFGAEPDEAVAVARFVAGRPALRLRGVFTHFAQADESDEQPSLVQSSRFDAVLTRIEAEGVVPELVHAANTAAVLRSPKYHRQLVRLGIGLYGLNPSPDVPVAPPMRPAFTLISRVKRVHNLHAGDGVSYGATYRAVGDERVALVPIGYADGYRRAFSNIGNMVIRGMSCPVRGRVCMDQTVIGLPDDLGEVQDGEPVIVGGAWGAGDAPSLDRLAVWAGTINYEIATGIAARVPRYSVRSGRVVGVEDLFGYRALNDREESNA